jgi:hypothetical protein
MAAVLRNLTHEITLAIQTRNGISVAVMIWMAVMTLALLAAILFLSAAGYLWLTLQFGNIVAALIMAAAFVAVAIVAAIVSWEIRRRVRQRAILARAAKARAPSWAFDPRILAAAVQIGRELGWQRLVPLALVGFMATQWAREHRERAERDAD